MPRRWILLLTLAGVVILVLLLWRSPPDELSNIISEASKPNDFPTSFIQNARTKQYDDMGRLNYTLDAITINYYEHNNKDKPETILEKPLLTMYEYNQNNPKTISLSTMSADVAEGNEKEDRLLLKGNVVLEQTNQLGEKTKLTTERLMVQPNRHYAETDKPVIITDKTGTTTATGLKVFFNEKRIELLSNVKGNYVPQ